MLVSPGGGLLYVILKSSRTDLNAQPPTKRHDIQSNMHFIKSFAVVVMAMLGFATAAAVQVSNADAEAVDAVNIGMPLFSVDLLIPS